MRVDDVAILELDRYCSPSHRIRLTQYRIRFDDVASTSGRPYSASQTQAQTSLKQAEVEGPSLKRDLETATTVLDAAKTKKDAAIVAATDALAVGPVHLCSDCYLIVHLHTTAARGCGELFTGTLVHCTCTPLPPVDVASAYGHPGTL